MNSNPLSRLSRSSRTVAVLLLAVGAAAAMALQVLMPSVDRSARQAQVQQPAVAPAMPASGEGPLIDHSVVDRDDLLPEPDPSPLAVAAYGA
jgi:hypothetical protein